MQSKYKQLVAAGLAAGLSLMASIANATAILDFSSTVTKATEELTSAVTTGLPLFGTITGIVVGIAVFRKFRKG